MLRGCLSLIVRCKGRSTSFTLCKSELSAAPQASNRGSQSYRPPDWCEGHHIVHWADGGSTSLTNAALLCGHHHRVVHRGQWQIQMHPHGRPEFIPPAHLDPQQRPRSNTIHLRL